MIQRYFILGGVYHESEDGAVCKWTDVEPFEAKIIKLEVALQKIENMNTTDYLNGCAIIIATEARKGENNES